MVHSDNTELRDQGGLTGSCIRDACSLGWRLGRRLLVYPITSFSEKPRRPRSWLPLVLAQMEGSQWDVCLRADALGQKILSKNVLEHLPKSVPSQGDAERGSVVSWTLFYFVT